MIPAEELVYELTLSMNKMGRKDNFRIPVPDALSVLNKAQISWIKSKINPNNVLRAGYESIRKRIDDLQDLKVTDFPLKPHQAKEPSFRSYYSSLEDISDYMFYLTSHSLAKKGNCEAVVYHNLVREGDLKSHYVDSNFSPSFKWRDTLVTIGENKLFVYVDDFEIISTHLTYLRYPKKIDIEGYTKIDGTQSVNQASELPYYALADLVDLATKFMAPALNNPLLAQAAEDRLIKNTE